MKSNAKKDFFQRIDEEMMSRINQEHDQGEAQQQMQKWLEGVEKEVNFN